MSSSSLVSSISQVAVTTAQPAVAKPSTEGQFKRQLAAAEKITTVSQLQSQQTMAVSSFYQDEAAAKARRVEQLAALEAQQLSARETTSGAVRATVAGVHAGPMQFDFSTDEAGDLVVENVSVPLDTSPVAGDPFATMVKASRLELAILSSGVSDGDVNTLVHLQKMRSQAGQLLSRESITALQSQMM